MITDQYADYILQRQLLLGRVQMGCFWGHYENGQYQSYDINDKRPVL